MTGVEIVRIAEAWLGTPYRHQASARGAGCDCLGLVRGVWQDAFGAEPETPPPYSADWDEVAGRDVLKSAAERLLVASNSLAPGVVVLFRMRRGAVAKHLGICSRAGADPRFIHAMSGRGVVSSALTPGWARRIDGIYAFPGVRDN